MRDEVARQLCKGSGPEDDGWGWLYALFQKLAPIPSLQRTVACRYFFPFRIEMAGDGWLYRALGVPRFGRLIPTGGIAVRRVTGAKMAPYTLAGISVAAARNFYYRACVFEFLHLPFFITLAILAMQRYQVGRVDWAIQETVINLVVNAYPMMHHRNTRRRIVRLLERHGRRTGAP